MLDKEELGRLVLAGLPLGRIGRSVGESVEVVRKYLYGDTGFWEWYEDWYERVGEEERGVEAKACGGTEPEALFDRIERLADERAVEALESILSGDTDAKPTAVIAAVKEVLNVVQELRKADVTGREVVIDHDEADKILAYLAELRDAREGKVDQNDGQKAA